MNIRKKPMKHDDAIGEQNAIYQSIKRQFMPHVWHDMVHKLKMILAHIRRDLGNA